MERRIIPVEGMKVDILDTVKKWSEAEILKVDKQNGRVYITYLYWDNKWNEWVYLDSGRIAPFGYRTFVQGGKLDLGMRIECCDERQMWLEAEVVEVCGDRAKIHYRGWKDHYDEWVPAYPGREKIRPYGREKPASQTKRNRTRYHARSFLSSSTSTVGMTEYNRETQLIADQSGVKAEWECSVCTLLNSAQVTICECCGSFKTEIVCPNGHGPLVPPESTSYHYTGSYICNICSQRGLHGNDAVQWCRTCNFDACPTCSAELKFELKGMSNMQEQQQLQTVPLQQQMPLVTPVSPTGMSNMQEQQQLQPVPLQQQMPLVTPVAPTVDSDESIFKRDLTEKGFTDIYEILLASGIDSYDMCKLMDDEIWTMFQAEYSHISQLRLKIVKKYIAKRCSEIFGESTQPGVITELVSTNNNEADASMDFPA